MSSNIKILIIEADLKTASNKLKKGDEFIIHQGGKEFKLTVQDVYSNQIAVTGNGEKYVILTTDYGDNKSLTVHKLTDSGKVQKTKLKNVEGISIMRGDKVIEKVGNPPSDEEPEVQEPESEEEKIQKSQEEIDADRLGEIKADFKGADENDIIEISTGFIDSKSGEIVKDKITTIRLNISEVIEPDKLYKVQLIDVKGVEADSYERLKSYDNIYLDLDKIKVSTSGEFLDLRLDIKVGDVETTGYVAGVFGIEVIPYERPTASAEDIMNNPILRKAMLSKPNLLQRMMGVKNPAGVIPGMQRFEKRAKKGNRVKFKYFGEPFGEGKFKLRPNGEYAARYQTKKSLSIVAKSGPQRGDRFHIELLGETGEKDEYKVEVRYKQDEFDAKEYKYRTTIKILDYDY